MLGKIFWGGGKIDGILNRESGCHCGVSGGTKTGQKKRLRLDWIIIDYGVAGAGVIFHNVQYNT